MQHKIVLYNSKTRKKELFEPINSPNVGIYVCGPTVYSEAHLGNARPAIVFDVLYRYLTHLKYKVRYVRNITDVGHLVADSDDGEDKITRKARLEKLEPMEVAEKYINIYEENMTQLNVLQPSIKPRATGHILEQQEMIQNIIKNGFAYEKNGSVYFDVSAFVEKHEYGKLSGRKIDELFSYTRQLKGQEEKKSPYDFALWKKAPKEHIMKWNSPWGEGFPGWHLECSCMSEKYLGIPFDIHGGGLDLLFPHHECEVAQSIAAHGKETVKFWVHNNLITVNGKKMAKSLGNFITLNELFTGKNKVLERAYPPMVVRFFMLQAHYRSTLDFSNKALQASEKGLKRLLDVLNTINKLKPSQTSTFDVEKFKLKCYDILNDDFNTAILIAHLFDGVKIINLVFEGKEKLTQQNIEKLKKLYETFIYNILGLKSELEPTADNSITDKLIDLLLETRQQIKKNKDYVLSDEIRVRLNELGFEIKDTQDGFEWKIKKTSN